MEKLHAPWSPEQVQLINAYQQSGSPLRLLCPHRSDAVGDTLFQALAPRTNKGLLHATAAGLRCSYCQHVQEWCWAFMTKPEPPVVESAGFSSFWALGTPNRTP
ncbi:hypothetical protein [Hymenobacter defluvii]|uniref:Uncharacterized protein n=1 Tax=Hymenobacter defluvii TaxID=2054411 RepID=A0ABS3TER5_9BACT|nr:hypothetical protein [Hymenobacter defluvii]MBO3272149.1 hypothetical protein [Hymenobacter defluvii]